VISKARLWSERTIAMNENVRALERAVQAGPESMEPASAMPSLSTMDLADEAVPVRESAPVPRTGHDFVTQGNAEMFGANDEAGATFVDIPGFEKERRFFADNSAQGEEAASDRFVVDRADHGRWDMNDGADEAVESSTPAATAQGSQDADGFLTGPRPVVSPKKIERPAPPPAPRAVVPGTTMESPTATATLDPDADAIDLYELGAIDCVQAV
jgi:hypothetical protein